MNTMNHGLINELSFHSELLDETFPLLVYLPEEYIPMQSYHLVLASDGKDYVQYGRIGTVLQQQMDEGKIEDAIYVGIPYIDKYHRRELYHPEGSRQSAYIDMIALELLPFLHEQFSLTEERDERILMGDSLAGTVSLMTAARYPHLFSKVIMHSPLVNDTVLQTAEQLIASDEPFSLYHVIGDQETAVRTTSDGIRDFLQPNRALRDALQQHTHFYFYDEFEGNHTWKYWQRDVPRAIETIFNN